MKKRPLLVTIISWVFIVAGSVGLVYHTMPLVQGRAVDMGRGGTIDTLVISFVRMLAIVAGVFMLRGQNWARWLCVAWAAFHVVVSIWHSPFELIMHIVVLLVLVYILFRRASSEYFQGASHPQITQN
jgi:hypothetical protein